MIITSDLPYVRSVVEQADVGLSYDSTDPADVRAGGETSALTNQNSCALADAMRCGLPVMTSIGKSTAASS